MVKGWAFASAPASAPFFFLPGRCAGAWTHRAHPIPSHRGFDVFVWELRDFRSGSSWVFVWDLRLVSSPGISVLASLLRSSFAAFGMFVGIVRLVPSLAGLLAGWLASRLAFAHFFALGVIWSLTAFPPDASGELSSAVRQNNRPEGRCPACRMNWRSALAAHRKGLQGANPVTRPPAPPPLGRKL